MASNRLFKRTALLQDASALRFAEFVQRDDFSAALNVWEKAAAFDRQKANYKSLLNYKLRQVQYWQKFSEPNFAFASWLVKPNSRLPQSSPNAPNQALALSLAAA